MGDDTSLQFGDLRIDPSGNRINEEWKADELDLGLNLRSENLP